jgi:hypothetical protein
MKIHKSLFLTVFIALSLIFAPSCQQAEKAEQEAAPKEAPVEITQEELSAAVPELSDLHEVVYPLWHTAFPDKDYELIKELLPEAESLTAKLNEAKLPGILRDKQEVWDKGKEDLNASIEALKKAVESSDQEGMLTYTEAFHAKFEFLVRTIRPVVKELEAFHQEMYKLYHYYLPNYELDLIRATVFAMQEKLVPLKEAQLPSRLADRQEDFIAAVLELEAAVNELAKIAEQDSKEEIQKAVDKAHTAYQKAEHIFD